MLDYEQTSVITVFMRDKTEGKVWIDKWGNSRVNWKMTKEDQDMMCKASARHLVMIFAVLCRSFYSYKQCNACSRSTEHTCLWCSRQYHCVSGIRGQAPAYASDAEAIAPPMLLEVQYWAR